VDSQRRQQLARRDDYVFCLFSGEPSLEGCVATQKDGVAHLPARHSTRRQQERRLGGALHQLNLRSKVWDTRRYIDPSASCRLARARSTRAAETLFGIAEAPREK
jgi:hypothetical protein